MTDRRNLLRALFAVLVLVGVFVVPRRAEAYTWMIRHDYGGCTACHADPSGGGPLTEYGRAQGDTLLRMHYGGSDADEVPKSAGFLLGLVTPPDWLLAGGDFRAMGLATKPNSAPLTTDFLLMQADLRAAIVAGGFRAGVSVGAISTDSSGASIVGPVVSREHWAGYAFGDGTWMVRAGRINMPYGIRSIEHTLFVRSDTRTDLNDSQQHGVAVAYNGEKVRGELLGILGNYQIQPDAYRQRGYSGYLEYSPVARLALGASSLVTRANKDLYLHVGDLRQAHGLFVRTAPWRPLVLLVEGDLVLHALDGPKNLTGHAAMAQADLEPIQGLHFVTTFELKRSGATNTGESFAAWAGANWFFLPHADLRLDAMEERLALGPSTLNIASYMAQLHLYL